eukprot:superscaffoldBa00003785_g17678
MSLKLCGGRVTTDPKEMRSHAVPFYCSFFGAEECDPDSAAELLEGRPQLSPEEKTDLYIELNLKELTAAVGQMASVSAYVDDLNVCVRDKGDMVGLQDSLVLYQKASSAEVNWAKSEALQRLLYHCGVWWHSSHLGYSKQLFLLRLEEADLTGLLPFSTSVLDAWKILKAARDPAATAGLWLFEEPLFFS